MRDLPTDYSPNQPHTFLYLATVAPEYYGQGFPPLRNHKVVAAALCRLCLENKERPVDLLGIKVIDDFDQEAALLSWISKGLRAADTPTPTVLTTFYGSTFGLPVLFYRSLHHGLPLYVPKYQLELEEAVVLDNPELRRLKVTEAAAQIGLPERYNVDIAGRFHEKDIDTLYGSVSLDMMISALVFLRLLLVGFPEYYHDPLSVVDYRAMSRKVMEAFYNLYGKPQNPRYSLVRDYLKSVDLKTFLLASKK